jgi:hypothetical protein
MHKHHEQQHPGGTRRPHSHLPYWKRAHTDWRFQLGVALMFAAILIYVLSGDLALMPRPKLAQPQTVPLGQ